MLIASTAFAQAPDDASVRGSTAVAQKPTAEASNDGIDWHQVGLGFSTAVGNLFYIPAKITYATLGGVAGGAAYVFTRGDHRAAHGIWHDSLGGDYVLTPSMLQGQHPIHFVAGGRENEQPMTNAASAPQSSESADLAVATKKAPGGAIPYSTVADSGHPGADSGHQFGILSAPQQKQADLNDEHGILVNRSAATAARTEASHQESVPSSVLFPSSAWHQERIV